MTPTVYPYRGGEGSLRWACCDSIIGPPCEHLTPAEAETRAAIQGLPALSGDPVAAARQVVETSGAVTVDGVLLDLFTASAVVQVADALSPANAQRLAGMSLPAAVAVVWKVIERSKP